MNRLDTAFLTCRQQGKTAFIPFLPAGDPDFDFTIDAIKAMAMAGAAAIEIGFPFSDPIADGPVIQAAYTRALAGGFHIDPLFERLKQLTQSSGWTTPIVGMASYSLIWRKGLTAFLDAAIAAGLSGVVVPDLPVEESAEFGSLCKACDFKMILLVTPTTSDERARAIVEACSGFVYVVSMVGITGSAAQQSNALPDLLKHLRTMTTLPLCVGFGISTPAHIKALKDMADGAIVGTALVRMLETAASDRAAAMEKLKSFAQELAKGTD